MFSVAMIPDRLMSAAKVIGTVWAAHQAYKLASFIHLHFLHQSTLQRYLHIKPNAAEHEAAWALVTGATDGIGRSFAEELCATGFNIILHGRNPSKLEAEREKLLSQWPQRSIRTLCIDASSPNSQDLLSQAASELTSLNLRILINNVGGTAGKPAFYPLHERNPSDSQMFININLRFPTEITRILLPQLRNHTPALIINVSSASADFGLPYLSIYSGAKAYNQSWSRCLASEMRAEGVDVEVIALVVSAVATDNYVKPQGVFVPDAKKFAKVALGAVGCGKSVVYPYWGHRVQSYLFELMPIWVAERIVVRVGRREMAEEAMLSEKTR